jgi:lactoylglutathione lyase
MGKYKFYHIHLLSRNPRAAADYYKKMFDAEIIESVQSDGKNRIDLDIDGVKIFILPAPTDEAMPEAPGEYYIGLDHFGLLVQDLDEAVSELRKKGAEFAMEPCVLRPGRKIAYVRAPENVRVEIVERS